MPLHNQVQFLHQALPQHLPDNDSVFTPYVNEMTSHESALHTSRSYKKVNLSQWEGKQAMRLVKSMIHAVILSREQFLRKVGQQDHVSGISHCIRLFIMHKCHIEKLIFQQYPSQPSNQTSSEKREKVRTLPDSIPQKPSRQRSQRSPVTPGLHGH